MIVTVNTFDISQYMKIQTIDRGGIIPPKIVEMITVKLRPGAIKASSKLDIRTIKIGGKIIGTSLEDVRYKAEMIGNIINTDDIVPITFADEPNITYFGMVIGETPIDEKNLIGEVSLTFVCFDPYKYGIEQTTPFDPTNEDVTFLNDTNANIYPIYTITATQKSTFAAIVSEDNHIIVGDPTPDNKTEVDDKQRLYRTTFSDVSGWNSVGVVADDFTQEGSFTINASNELVAADFGTWATGDPLSWHGPAYIRDLSVPATDFEFTMDFYNKRNSTNKKIIPTETGRVLVSFLDINGNVVAKASVGDMYPTIEAVRGEFWLGSSGAGKKIWSYYTKHWKDFFGFVRVKRIKKKWTVQVGLKQYHPTKEYYRAGEDYTDDSGSFSADISKIQISVQKYRNNAARSMRIENMYFYKYNGYTPDTQNPYIIDPDDVIEIDTEQGIIFKNTKVWMEHLDPTSDLFPLKPGATILDFVPKDKGFTVDVSYKKRWL